MPASVLVHLEKILQRDRRQRLRFLLDRHFFLGLDRLVQSVGPLPAGHFAAGVFVDDDDFHRPLGAALDDVILVALVNDVGAHRLLHQVRPFHVVADEKAADAGGILRGGDAFMRQMDALAVQFHLVILRRAPSLRFSASARSFSRLLLAAAGGFLLRPCSWPCPHRLRRP